MIENNQSPTDSREEALTTVAKKYFTPRISNIKNFFTQKEIANKQGFNRETSNRNLSKTKEHLRAGFDYIQQHAIQKDSPLLLEEKARYEALKGSHMGIMKEEAPLFELIISNLTLQHASPTQKDYGESLTSIRQREIAGEKILLKRTGNHLGRQNFIYFVTGVGQQVNAPGLHNFHTYLINLKQLDLKDRDKSNQIYVSPHLSEFETNACSAPVLLCGAGLDIQFKNADQSITYSIKRPNGLLIERVYHHHDFVFFSGGDVLYGSALRFIELLRLIGDPYRQHLLSSMLDSTRSDEQKISQLSEAMSVIMSGSMVLEAKIPQEIQLSQSYTTIIAKNDNITTNTSEISFCADQNNSWAELSSEEVRHILEGDRLLEDPPVLTGHIPYDLNVFFSKLINSSYDESIAIIQSILSASFASPIDKELRYLMPINQRETTGTRDLLLEVINGRWVRGERKIALVKIIFPFLSKEKQTTDFCEYVAVAAHFNISEIIEFLLQQNVPLRDSQNLHLINWVSYRNAEKLLEYMFIQNSLNINGLNHGYSWLEYAILYENEKAALWLINHGATLHRLKPSVMKLMSPLVSEKLNLPLRENINETPIHNPRSAVVALVTATDYNGDKAAIMGRCRINDELAGYWSFPGGEVDEDEGLAEAALREVKEETSAELNLQEGQVKELLKVELDPEHKRILDNGIGSVTFFQIDLGKRFLPAVWPDDDLGDVRKIKIYDHHLGGFSDVQKGFPIRPSNAYLIEAMNKPDFNINEQELSLVLFAEAYPLIFVMSISYELKQINKILAGEKIPDCLACDPIRSIVDDRDALILFKEKTLENLQRTMLRINPVLKDEIKGSILAGLITGDNLELLQFFLANEYSLQSLPQDFRCSIVLIKGKSWDMLEFLSEHAPTLLYCNKYDWELTSKLLPSIREEKIKTWLIHVNKSHIIYEQLLVVVSQNNNAEVETRLGILKEIKDFLNIYPNFIAEFEERHFNLIILSGDTELYDYCKPRLSFQYRWASYNVFSDVSAFLFIKIKDYLVANNHSAMLSILEENKISAVILEKEEEHLQIRVN